MNKRLLFILFLVSVVQLHSMEELGEQLQRVAIDQELNINSILCDDILDKIIIPNNITPVCRRWHEIFKRNITSLRTTIDRAFTRNDFLTLGNFEGLQTLDLRSLSIGSILTPATIAAMANSCTGLKNIYFDNWALEWRGDNGRSICDESLGSFVCKVSNLQTIVLGDLNVISDCGVEYIATFCRGLKNLALGAFSNVTDLGIKSLVESCRELRYIHLGNGSYATDKSIYYLSLLPNLEYVYLGSGSKVTDVGISFLAQNCRNLKCIDFGYETRVTSQGLLDLAINCPRLIYLAFGDKYEKRYNSSYITYNGYYKPNQIVQGEHFDVNIHTLSAGIQIDIDCLNKLKAINPNILIDIYYICADSRAAGNCVPSCRPISNPHFYHRLHRLFFELSEELGFDSEFFAATDY